MQRSDALNEWIAKHSTSEGLIEDLPNLSPSLKKELLREALELNIDIRQNYENRDGSVKAIRDQIALVAYCKTKEVFGNVSLDIPLLNSTNTLSFNILDNSSLFGVFIPNIQERRYFRNEVLACRKNVAIEYTGQALYQFDWDVFHMLITLAQGDFSKAHTTTPSEILHRLGLTAGGENYVRLEQTMIRLYETGLYIHRLDADGQDVVVVGRKMAALSPSQRNYKTMRLIQNYSWFRGLEISFELDPQIRSLVGHNEYGLIDWESRKKLQKNDLAKKLQALFSGHENMQNHSLAKLKEWSGLSSEWKEFSRQLKKALNELIRYDIIHSYWLYKPSRGEIEKRYLRIWRKKPPSGQEPIPKEKGDYFTKDIIMAKKRGGKPQ